MANPEVGDLVKDQVSGIEGVLTGRAIWLNGCVQFLLRPKAGKGDNKFPDGIWMDGHQLKVLKAQVVPFKGPKTTGGLEIPEGRV